MYYLVKYKEKQVTWLIQNTDHFWEGGAHDGEEALRVWKVVGFKLGAVYNGISCIIPLHTLDAPVMVFDILNILYNQN